MVPIIYSEAFLAHDTGFAHPENAGRLTAIVQALCQSPWSQQLTWCEPRSDREVLSLIEILHERSYIRTVSEICQRGGGALDADTIVSARSYELALLAVQAWLDGVDQTLASAEPSFVLARPPGHHALADRAMGFCIFGNAAIAATYALQQAGVDRVAILDWDVHHGNGTQALVEGTASIAYCSLHQSPCYPYSGFASETGGHQNVLNRPMAPGAGRAEYQAAFTEQVLPLLKNFQPDLLIVSAGYDANRDDPLAEICLQPEDYGWFTTAILGMTRRIVFGLEGGYDYASLGASVVATVEAVLAEQSAERSTEQSGKRAAER
jgi:acetoin utilization deacetylase AcuC-like enzyme